MYLFFEESGHYKVGRMMQQQGEAFQVELSGGKRTKVKKNQILIELTDPISDLHMSMAELQSQEVDLDLLWESIGDEALFFVEVAKLYYGDRATITEQISCFFALNQSPIYFRRKGKGVFQRAPAEQLEAAKQAQLKKAAQLALQEKWQQQLELGEMPNEIREQALTLLTCPDKNSSIFKALELACAKLQISPEKLFLQTGVISSSRQVFEARFLQKFFPKGTGFGVLPPLNADEKSLPELIANVFSIDDSYTTEIDDAFSVTFCSESHVQIGIHIACPSLSIIRGDSYDKVARQRLSTVYMPGQKITMLPDEVIEHHSLTTGVKVPALSLLVDLDPNTWASLNPPQTQLHWVCASANLRYDQLDDVITTDNLANGTGDYAYKTEITQLWQWAKVLRQAREEKKGKPERNQLDYQFRVLESHDETGENHIAITPRLRGSPLDMIVAELMIFANCTWASWLQTLQVPAIYRVQKAFGLNRTRSQTHPGPHDGLGADVYAWCTSPLRRYVDLVNQWQLLASVEHGTAARLAAPFKPKEVDLMAIVSDFDATYGQYADIQSQLERYWCLKWLVQNDRQEMLATAIKEELYRLADVPLVVKINGRNDARGSQVRLRLGVIDWFDLSIEASVVEILQTNNNINHALSAIEDEVIPVSELTELSGLLVTTDEPKVALSESEMTLPKDEPTEPVRTDG